MMKMIMTMKKIQTNKKWMRIMEIMIGTKSIQMNEENRYKTRVTKRQGKIMYKKYKKINK